ncbi:unnamed protein product [Pleuronectes platessa]|uniref:Uncharacterized protein n=1 Tax=Pleuronectes platessa TaxID=8262 RepID=A0A9N7V131_PLEPL|nr:unnamed protein product [Pleuronectes platessa]
MLERLEINNQFAVLREHSPPLSGPHTPSSASQAKEHDPALCRSVSKGTPGPAPCTICISVSKRSSGPKQTHSTLGTSRFFYMEERRSYLNRSRLRAQSAYSNNPWRLEVDFAISLA